MHKQNKKIQVKSSIYTQYYAEARNEWWGPSSLLSARATQLCRNVAAVISRWRHCVQFDRRGKQSHTFCTDGDAIAECSSKTRLAITPITNKQIGHDEKDKFILPAISLG